MVTRGDEELVQAFENATGAVLEAWGAGAFFPRVVEPTGREEPGRCGFCSVAEACLRGDSGARLRLFEWTRRAQETIPAIPAEEALLKVWRLWEKPGKEDRMGVVNLEGEGEL